jgi:hypothetical protein
MSKSSKPHSDLLLRRDEWLQQHTDADFGGAPAAAYRAWIRHEANADFGGDYGAAPTAVTDATPKYEPSGRRPGPRAARQQHPQPHVQDQAEEGKPRRSRIVWKDLLTADFGALDWLQGGLMVKGQLVAMVGAGKAGKSLLCQEWAARMVAGQPFLGGGARDPLRVLYLDRENSHGDLQERFLAIGADMDALDERLIYESFPEDIPPLDTRAGGAVLAAMVEDAQADVVFIDTISRFVEGKENDADTWTAAYRNSLVPLKSRGVSVIRLDHFGKDTARGARGNSAKTQDVDHVWELSAVGDNLLRLLRTHTRTGHGEDSIAIQRLGEKVGADPKAPWAPGKTRHERAGSPVSGQMRDLIRRLDEAGVPKNLGRDKVRAECQRLNIPLPRSEVLAEAIKLRKNGQAVTSLDDFRSEPAPDPFEESA